MTAKMTVTRQDIVTDLKALGLKLNDIVLVHGSLSRIGMVDGGADTVIDALLEVIGDGGTLLMPSFQHGSEFFLAQSKYVFDVRNSPSEVGIITETFRKRHGVIRSLSPTHCTAGIGLKAWELLKDHEQCHVSVGLDSPYHKLVQAWGKILLLGVTHSSNTTLHFVENTNGAPTLCRQLFEPSVIDNDGKIIMVPTWPHMPGLQRHYPRVENVLLEHSLQQNGKIGDADSKLIDAQGMSELIGGIIKRDPMFLIVPFCGN